MRVLFRWHDFAVKYFVIIQLFLVCLTLFFAVDLKQMRVDSDWFELFSRNDPVYERYCHLPQVINKYSSVYLKIPYDPGLDIDTLIHSMEELNGISFVRRIPIEQDASHSIWLEIGLAEKNQKETVADIKAYLKNIPCNAGITGAVPIQEEFNASMQKDFVKVSFIALLAMIAVIIIFFRFSLSVLLGFWYQSLGLVCAVIIFQRVFGPLNVLSATLPCVLLGLGIDYVIHCMSASGSICVTEKDSDTGKIMYHRILLPIFWGALTTALAFVSLSLSGLKGLALAGIFGGLGIMCMFLFVIFFLPPAVSRLEGKTGLLSNGLKIVMPLMYHKKRVTVILVLPVCIVLSCFIGKVTFEDKVENLYDTKMPSLKLQEELARKIHMYPSRLFLLLESKNIQNDLNTVKKHQGAYVPDFEHVLVSPSDKSSFSRGILPIFPRYNPFDYVNFSHLSQELTTILGYTGNAGFSITGDAVLYHHLNRLLMRGMGLASVAVLLFLAAVLFLVFRNKQYVFGCLAVLVLSLFGTLGGYGLFSLSLSVYTIILFPLFLGIGIDDCLHIAYLSRKGGSLVPGSYVLKGITLTTLTTLLCYGSLITARNAGFNAMGKAALLGLSLVYFCSVYVLPVFLKNTESKTIN